MKGYTKTKEPSQGSFQISFPNLILTNIRDVSMSTEICALYTVDKRRFPLQEGKNETCIFLFETNV